MDIFEAIKKEYELLEQNIVAQHGNRFYNTQVGIYGPAFIDVIFRFLRELKPKNDAHFLDLGAGDGRVVLVASLFCKASGIEYDSQLVRQSQEIARRVGAHCELLEGDFLELDISSFDIFFINPDQSFHNGLEQKLRREMKPHQRLWVHNNIFLPSALRRGRTIWIDQMPITEFSNEGVHKTKRPAQLQDAQEVAHD